MQKVVIFDYFFNADTIKYSIEQPESYDCYKILQDSAAYLAEI